MMYCKFTEYRVTQYVLLVTWLEIKTKYECKNEIFIQNDRFLCTKNTMHAKSRKVLICLPTYYMQIEIIVNLTSELTQTFLNLSYLAQSSQVPVNLL